MKILIMGCRSFGQEHIKASIKAGLDVCIMERNDEIREMCKNKFSIKEAYSDINSSLESDADIVDIVLPTHIHKEVSIKAMKKGKHVILEKPMAKGIDEAIEIMSVTKETGKKFMVAEQFFFDPAVEYVRKTLEKGELGKIFTIIVRDQRLYRGGDWRTRTEFVGGGALSNGGIHMIDSFLNFGGEYSEIKSYIYHTVSTVEAEDTIESLFKFTSGAHGLFFYSWGYQNPHIIPKFEVIGENGWIIEEPRDSRINNNGNQERKNVYGNIIHNDHTIVMPRENLIYKEIQQFMNSILEDKPVPFQPSLAFRDLLAIKKIYESTNF